MSKSVKLSASDATTGRKKNTPMTARAGARNHQAARAVPRSTVVTAGRAAPDRLLAVVEDAGRDQLPLRDLGRRHDALQLLPERLRGLVRRERRVAPRLEPRRQVARQAVDAQLLLRARQELDQLPRSGLVARRAEHH